MSLCDQQQCLLFAIIHVNDMIYASLLHTAHHINSLICHLAFIHYYSYFNIIQQASQLAPCGYNLITCFHLGHCRQQLPASWLYYLWPQGGHIYTVTLSGSILVNTTYSTTFAGGKLLQLEYKVNIHGKNFVVAASFSNECLLLVNFLLKNIHS